MARSSTTFKPGQVTNPNGRPKKGESLTDILRGMADQEIEVKIKGKKVILKNKEALAAKFWQMALNGDRQAIIELYNRMDGKAHEKMSMDVNADVGKFIATLGAFGGDDETATEKK